MENVKQVAGVSAAPVERPSPITTVHTEYVTAQRVPIKRNLKAIMKEAMDIAELSGELFFYRWETSSTDQRSGQKKKSFVVGHSVKLTNEAVRLFGNCVVQQQPVQETSSAWIFISSFVDLETGFTRERQYRMSKEWPVYGKMDRFRKDDIRFQIGQSKADRNVILNALPQIITDRMLEAAINSVRKQIEFKIKDVYGGNIQKAIDEILKAFAPYDIDQQLIEEKLGLKRDKWDINTLVMLTGDAKALKAGTETKETLYSLDETSDENGGGATPPEKGLSAADMSPGDAAAHQGYQTESPMESPNEIESLIKEYTKGGLVELLTNEIGAAFVGDVAAGDAFLNDCVKVDILKSTDLSKASGGQLAQAVVKLRHRGKNGKAGF